MNEMLEWLSLWGVIPALGLMGLAVCWHLMEILRYRRKSARLARRMAKPPEEMQPRPLISDDRVAMLRAGDTVLLLPSLDGMTERQREQMMEMFKEISERMAQRGIVFHALPGNETQKAIVVARNDLPKPPEDEATKKANAEWLAQIWNESSKRDQVALAALHDRVEKINQESAAATLREARLQWEKSLEPLIQGLLKKAQALQGSQFEPADVQALLEDVHALSEAIGKTS